MDLLSEIKQQFPEVSKVTSLGKSLENRDITLLTLGIDIEDKEMKCRDKNPPSVLMTSVHHAREVVTVTMNLYIMLRLLHGYLHKEASATELLKMHNIYSVPMVNVDSYAHISETWEKTGKFVFLRKNRRDDGG